MADAPNKTRIADRAEIDAAANEEIAEKTMGARPIDDVTAVHDEGSGANETDDGLDDLAESVRHMAEDVPTGQDPAGRMDDIPVFDRGDLPPKV